MTPQQFTSVLHQLDPGTVVGFFLVLARITPLFILAPLFSSKMLPNKVKTIVGVSLAMGLTPVATHGLKIPTGTLTLTGLLIENLLVGLAFALAVGAVFAAIEAAGGLIDVVAGFSYGQLINPMDGTQAGVMTNFYSIIGLALFVAVGGDAWTLRGIARTMQLVPVTKAPSITSLTAGVVSAGASIFVAAIEVAAPALLALLVTDVAFGIVSRVVPQVNVFGVGFSLKVGVAILIVAASLPFIGGFMSDQLQSAVNTALNTI